MSTSAPTTDTTIAMTHESMSRRKDKSIPRCGIHSCDSVIASPVRTRCACCAVHTAAAAGAAAKTRKTLRPMSRVNVGVASARAVKTSSSTVIALLAGRDGGQGEWLAAETAASTLARRLRARSEAPRAQSIRAHTWAFPRFTEGERRGFHLLGSAPQAAGAALATPVLHGEVERSHHALAPPLHLETSPRSHGVGSWPQP